MLTSRASDLGRAVVPESLRHDQNARAKRFDGDLAGETLVEVERVFHEDSSHAAFEQRLHRQTIAAICRRNDDAGRSDTLDDVGELSHGPSQRCGIERCRDPAARCRRYPSPCSAACSLRQFPRSASRSAVLTPRIRTRRPLPAEFAQRRGGRRPPWRRSAAVPTRTGRSVAADTSCHPKRSSGAKSTVVKPGYHGGLM